jgi:predicted lipoprotein with Yx(FWY)xxD motif
MLKTCRLPASCSALLLAAAASFGVAAHEVPVKAVDGVLTTTDGMTLYTFDKDMAGKSACNGPCATLWPPLMAAAGDHPAAGYTIVTRDDGSLQWAYQGKPLYRYQHDAKAGDRSGDNFKDVWHLVKP